MNIKYNKPQGFYFYPDIVLTEEQKIIIKNVKEWLNVKRQKYIIGAGGLAIKRLSDGKIFVIKDFVETKDLKNRGIFMSSRENKVEIIMEISPDRTWITVDVDELI